MKPPYCINKNWETVSCIIEALLISKSAEWLAGRSTDDYVRLFYLGILKAYRERLRETSSV